MSSVCVVFFCVCFCEPSHAPGRKQPGATYAGPTLIFKKQTCGNNLKMDPDKLHSPSPALPCHSQRVLRGNFKDVLDVSLRYCSHISSQDVLKIGRAHV